ncbi:MAG TPA: Gfo/Idh/MocA family oxidoreductase [Nitrolancea sp.]|nr:Gfo/Idh/MocA family oxidoreductase [Nitrolancea sp.]
MSLDRPLDVALIGTGNRSQTTYQPLFASLQPWVRLVAVCDPVRENADAFAAAVGVPAFYSLRDLVQARICEAALVVTPIDGHSAISCYLSAHGIHHLVETSMASSLVQGRRMVDAAHEHNVTLRIAENFFRFPFDRIAKVVADSGFIGAVKRLTCFHDHLGYHNNSRWIVFYGAYPESVQAFSHTMPTAPHHQAAARAHRHHESETFNIRLYTFPDNRLVTDLAGNIKGMLGRYPRPGYTEIDGARGTIVQQATNDWQGDLAVQQETENWQAKAEVRYCTDAELERSGQADQIFPIVNCSEEGNWTSTYVNLPSGRIEYVNPYRPSGRVLINRDYYGAAVMGHIVDFAKAVRGVAPSEYTEQDALMAMMMEMGGRESARRDGARIALPLAEDLEVDELSLAAQRQKYGVDPLDVEAMLAVSYPKP